MDFLGLKTLSIIKDALTNIELNRGIKVDINSIDMDDAPNLQTLLQWANHRDISV